MTRWAPLISVVALALALCGCGGERRPASAPPRTITNLHDIAQLRGAFAKASGEPRLVVIVSPT